MLFEMTDVTIRTRILMDNSAELASSGSSIGMSARVVKTLLGSKA